MKKSALAPISGYLEWLPEIRGREQQLLDRLRSHLESYGFCNIETPIVERLDTLLSKGGDADKEMYVLRRLADEAPDRRPDFGLRYDLTVPTARYVAQHAGHLVFPFKRYQIQPCWRGERPQDGRYRQFTQCDFDVIGNAELPLAHDAELAELACELLDALQIGDFQMRLSNRKILEAYLQGIGVHDVVEATRLLDKIDKIGREAVHEQLSQRLGSAELAERSLALASIRTPDSSFRDQVLALGEPNERLRLGLDELSTVMDMLVALDGHARGRVLADLSVTRGFNYYTGTVYEAQWSEYPQLGTICGGGRYDDLASSFSNRRMPGVGLSIGFTRIFAKLVAEGRVQPGPRSPTQVLVAWLEPCQHGQALSVATQLRGRGLRVEVYGEAAKLKKQLQYANRKGVPHVWLVPDGAVKDMESGEQVAADPGSWLPAPVKGE